MIFKLVELLLFLVVMRTPQKKKKPASAANLGPVIIAKGEWAVPPSSGGSVHCSYSAGPEKCLRFA